MSDDHYILQSLLLSGFRAFLSPKEFRFSNKPCLAVFAPNASGKSSIIDAFEFMFSEEGTLERLGLRAIHNNAGVAALAHNLARTRGFDSLVTVKFSRGRESTEGSRSASEGERPRPGVADAVSVCFSVPPIIRGN